MGLQQDKPHNTMATCSMMAFAKHVHDVAVILRLWSSSKIGHVEWQHAGQETAN